jgi:hypothetical protein
MRFGSPFNLTAPLIYKLSRALLMMHDGYSVPEYTRFHSLKEVTTLERFDFTVLRSEILRLMVEMRLFFKFRHFIDSKYIVSDQQSFLQDGVSRFELLNVFTLNILG